MKQCIVYDNEEVHLYHGERIKVKAKMPNEEHRYVLDSDEDITYLFE